MMLVMVRLHWQQPGSLWQSIRLRKTMMRMMTVMSLCLLWIYPDNNDEDMRIMMMLRLMLVTLAAARLTVAVNQGEETSRQLHIVQLHPHTYTQGFCYEVAFVTNCRENILRIVLDADRPIFGVWQICGQSNTLSILSANDIPTSIAYIANMDHWHCPYYLYSYELLRILRKILPVVLDADRPIRGVWQLCRPTNTLSILIAVHIAIYCYRHCLDCPYGSLPSTLPRLPVFMSMPFPFLPFLYM